MRDDDLPALERWEMDPGRLITLSNWAAPPSEAAARGAHRDAEYTGRGHGTDAMRVIVGYGFRELSLHRIQLGVVSFNTAGIRAYGDVCLSAAPQFMADRPHPTPP